jgi:glucokinase
LLRGAIGRAGHLGHICLDPNGDRDIVNTPGSLEMFVGNYTIAQRTGNRFGTTHELVAAHRAGDAEATRIWLRAIHHLACGIVSIVNAVDPETIILGGGVMAAGDTLLKPLHEELDKHEWRPHGHKVKIVAASLGEFAGAIGAAYNAIQHSR